MGWGCVRMGVCASSVLEQRGTHVLCVLLCEGSQGRGRGGECGKWESKEKIMLAVTASDSTAGLFGKGECRHTTQPPPAPTCSMWKKEPSAWRRKLSGSSSSTMGTPKGCTWLLPPPFPTPWLLLSGDRLTSSCACSAPSTCRDALGCGLWVRGAGGWVPGRGGEGAEGVECRGNGKAEVPGFRLRVMSTDPICRTRAAQCAGPPANTHFGLGGRAWLPGLLQTLLSLILGTHHALKLAPDPAPHSLHCHPQTHAPAAPAPLKDTRLHPLKRTHLIVQVFIQRLPHLHA